jgi:glycosyltransferase involved in cell wall biosynthesis
MNKVLPQATKHALFVAFHFPPEASSSGVLRTLKFANYLLEFGWRVSVLSVEVDAYEITDGSLLEQVNPQIQVYRTRYLNSKTQLSIKGFYPSLLALPDRWMGWRFWAVAQGLRVHENDSVDLIFSTSPHATAHIIASALQKKLSVPWVMDFRDPWHEEPPELGTPWLVHRYAQQMERRYVHQARAVITTTAELSETFKHKYPAVQANIHSIYNGYDEVDFEHAVLSQSQATETLQIIHAGSINDNFRDPTPLFQALGKLLALGVVEPKEVQLDFYGAGRYAQDCELQGVIERNGLSQMVHFHARLPYRQVLVKMMQAQALLLLQASEDTRTLIPAKLFEYLRTQRPVLALVQEGASAQLVRELAGGWAVNPTDDTALIQVLQQLIESWKDKRLSSFSCQLDAIQQYSRRNLTEQLAELFDSLVPTPASSQVMR